jgi:hypothetical protein
MVIGTVENGILKGTVSSTYLLRLGCPRNKQNKFSVRTATNRFLTCFGCFSFCFAKPINYFFCSFLCFGSISKQPKTNRSVSKQTEKNQNKIIGLFYIQYLHDALSKSFLKIQKCLAKLSANFFV